MFWLIGGRIGGAIIVDCGVRIGWLYPPGQAGRPTAIGRFRHTYLFIFIAASFGVWVRRQNFQTTILAIQSRH